MRLRKTPAAIAALGTAAALAIAGCSSGGSSTTGSSSPSAAPAQLTVWRMGSSTPAQVTWMNDVVSQFRKISGLTCLYIFWAVAKALLD